MNYFEISKIFGSIRTREQRLGFLVNAFPRMSMDELAEYTGYKNGRVVSSVICRKKLRH